MEDWKELVVFCFFYNRLQSIYTSIVSCVYNLKHTHILFSDLWCKFLYSCHVRCYFCSVLTSSMITLLENVSYIVS